MGIAKQGWNAHDGSQHLGIERTATIANQKVRLFMVNQFSDVLDGIFRMYRQVGRKHLCTTGFRRTVA